MHLLKTVYKCRKCSVNLSNTNSINSKMNDREQFHFLKEFSIIFLQNFKDFRAKLEYLKNVQAVTFSKIHCKPFAS